MCTDIRVAEFYSLIADESKDASKKEQLSICVRYVNANSIINERFLTYVEISSQNAESLSHHILTTLKENASNPLNMVSQAYDGASVMSERCRGVQAPIKEFAPKARYVHCYAHSLNLALVDCIKSVQHAWDFFSLIEALYIFVSTSKAHPI
ncbi:Zinc finger MYM-type protein 1-like [Oopsacas minuta]|uniref:Zinc finger MYM-type protein 1-like n=1 Tax=Oopsacas minuta TaxID=111878 RepID=A0AAV7K7T2_9METZ|nr:Zinc finger MYM-type protein 1-like [Oopsacas minuta]